MTLADLARHVGVAEELYASLPIAPGYHGLVERKQWVVFGRLRRGNGARHPAFSRVEGDSGLGCTFV